MDCNYKGMPLSTRASPFAQWLKLRMGGVSALLLQQREGGNTDASVPQTGEREAAFCITPLYPSFTFQTLAPLRRAPFSVWNANHCWPYLHPRSCTLPANVRELGARHVLRRFPTFRPSDDWSCCTDIRLWNSSFLRCIGIIDWTTEGFPITFLCGRPVPATGRSAVLCPGKTGLIEEGVCVRPVPLLFPPEFKLDSLPSATG